MKNVLIEPGKEENLVSLDRAAECASDLLLAAVRFEREEREARPERTIAQIVKPGAVKMIGSRFGDDVYDGSPCPALFRAVGVGRYPEFLHDLGRELIRSTITAASLGEERIVVVAAVDKKKVF